MNMKSIKDKLKRKNSSIYNDDSAGDARPKDDKEVPDYSAVGSTRLVYSQSLNSQLSLLIGKYDSMIQVDRVVDMVETLLRILDSQTVSLLQQLWRDYQQTATLALRTKLSVQMLKLMVNIEGFTWDQVKHMQGKLMVLIKNIECQDITREEEMKQTLQRYNQRRKERSRMMKMLGNIFNTMAKLLGQVYGGQGLGTVPDIDGCLRDCNFAMGELSCEEWEKILQPVLRLVLVKFQVIGDIVDMVWVELGMEERFYRLCDKVKQRRRGSVKKDKGVLNCKAVESSNTTGSDGDVFDDLTNPCIKVKEERDDAVVNQVKNKASSTSTWSDHAPDQKLSGSDEDISLALSGYSAEDQTTPGESFKPRGLFDMQTCPPLGSSTPRRRKSLPSNDDIDIVVTATEVEVDDMIKTKDLLVLFEQVMGLSAPFKLHEELKKLAGSSDTVRWTAVDKLLDQEPDIVFK